MRLKIAARKSDLARLQAYRVGNALRQKFPSLEIEYQFKESLGDKNLHDPLWKMPERGVFTEDFHADLLAENIDLVVHSWKDLPTEEREGSEICATLPRADSRDLLLVKKSALARKTRQLKLFSSSPRRAYTLPPFLKNYFPYHIDSVEFQSVRGNIATRLRKYRELEIDGLLVAKAALDRLLETSEPEFADSQKEIRSALEISQWMVLPLEAQPTAAAQGALAIEVKSSRSDLKKFLSAINCAATLRAVERERKILSGYGGGCHQKIGISVIPLGELGDVIYLRGETDKGEILNSTKLNGPSKPEQFSPAQKWPETPEGKLFSRHALNVSQPKVNALFVTREESLPESWNISAETIVWTSGLKTWKKLSDRGIWVNGSCESRGETLPEVQGLAPQAKFVKLSHTGAPEDLMPVVATYELRPTPNPPSFAGKKSFFWMSGSAFDEALRLDSGILQGEHACGPGHTYTHLRKILPKDKKIQVFLSYKDWQAG